MTGPVNALTVFPSQLRPLEFANEMDQHLSELELFQSQLNDLAAQMGVNAITLATGIAAFLLSPSSANLRAAMTDKTGTGLLVFNDGAALINPTITNYTETVYAPAAGSAFTVSLTNGTLQKFTTNANTMITLPTPAAGKAYTIQIAYGGTHTLTWAGGGTIKWPANTAPPATSVNGKFDTFMFMSFDGTRTFGFLAGANA